MKETHPVLNRDQFIALSADTGYTGHTASRMFNYIARDWQQEMRSGPRTSSDICYEEQTRSGKLETMISVPNMYVRIEQVRDIHGVGRDLGQFCLELIDAAMQQSWAR